MGGGVRITKGHESGGGHVRITLGHEKEGDIKTNKNTQLGTQKNNEIKNVHLGPKQRNNVNGQSGSKKTRGQEKVTETKEGARSTNNNSIVCGPDSRR